MSKDTTATPRKRAAGTKGAHGKGGRGASKPPSSPAKAPKAGLAAFHTRSMANTGQRVPLVLPDGVVTAEWVHVLGIDSDVFQKAHAKLQRVGLMLAEEDNADVRHDKLNEAKLEMIASLVTDWSFAHEADPIPCTLENVIEFLREAPQIAQAIDRITSNRKLFYAGLKKA